MVGDQLKIINFLMLVVFIVSSILAVLASSGWTPQGNSESQPSLRAHILTAPTITASGLFPASGVQAGTTIHIWCTYTDADNDAPTYIRVERYLIPNLQPPIYNMVANDSGDTTYSDGKLYHYDWYYFPFIGSAFIQIQAKSGAEAQVTKNIAEDSEPMLRLTHTGVSPISNEPDNYTFFTNYSNVFNVAPAYVRVNINGTEHDLSKNDTGDITYIDGVNYSVTVPLDVGNHTYYFHSQASAYFPVDISNGVDWLVIPAPSSGSSFNFGLLLIVGLVCASVIIVWRLK